jgi:hypothetical protein
MIVSRLPRRVFMKRCAVRVILLVVVLTLVSLLMRDGDAGENGGGGGRGGVGGGGGVVSVAPPELPLKAPKAAPTPPHYYTLEFPGHLAPVAPPRPLKIALCIVGTLRTFLLPPVFESIHRNLVAVHPQGTVDVYFHLSLHHSGKRYDVECSGEGATLATAQSLFNPLETVLSTIPSNCAHTRFNGTCCTGPFEGHVTEGNFMQASRIAKCFEAAASRGGQHYYTHYVRARPDLYIGAPFPPWVWGEQHAAHKIFTSDKDAPASDMLFAFGSRLLTAWWRRLPLRNCTQFPVGGSLEYFLFDGVEQASFSPRLYNTGYNRSAERGREGLPAEVDYEPPPDSVSASSSAGSNGGAHLQVHQLVGLGVMLVRGEGGAHVDCHAAGFFCMPRDKRALEATLQGFQCFQHHPQS